MKIARRLAGITVSPTIAVMQEAQNLRRQGVDIIDLGPGEPDFPTPEAVKQMGIAAIHDNFTRYTAVAGIQELREAIATKYNREWGTRLTAKNVIVTCGAKHAIYSLCMALFEEGDEVLIPSPYWVTFPEVVNMTGARPVYVPTLEEHHFVLQPGDLESRVTPSSRGLIVNTPNNPTGAVLPRDITEEAIGICRKNEIYYLSDETYEYFVYDNHPHTSAAAFMRSDDEGVGIVGSLSKTYSMTGWRIGYLVANEQLIQKLTEFQSHQTGNPTSVSQKAALGALNADISIVASMKNEYENRRQLVLRGLEGIPGFRCPVPYGAFYAFPNVTEAMAATGIESSAEFSRFLIREARVATVPGSAFGIEGYIRLSYATSVENLREGLERMRKAVEQASSKAAPGRSS